MTTKQIVESAVTALFVDRTPDAIDTHFGPVYIQHSALGVDGLEGVRALAAGLPPTFRYELLRTLADGDLAVTQGLYHGFGPGPVVGFDVWRVDGERIAEHWDALGPLTGPDAIDGTAAASPSAVSAESRAVVQRWIDALPGDDADLRSAAFADHGAAQAQVRYDTIHQIIADGDFVYVRSEGDAGVPSIVNDLWRVEERQLAEHWSLVAPVPPQLPHDNGSF
jgi:predicted SnoaL-like aldol condensation-catalyzing enzyme